MELSKKVGKSRAAMIEFLRGHFRYNTANSWNRATSYAHNVKIYRVIPRDLQDKAFEILEQGQVSDGINFLFDDFMRKHAGTWQAGFNGRSGGYLVLYIGGSRPSAYKSYCVECGQGNCTTTDGGNKCGRCGENSRINYEPIPTEYFSYPGKGVDMEDDFEEWDIDALRDRVKIVKEFDALADAVVNTFIAACKGYDVVEKTVMVPKTVKVLREVKQ